MATDDFVRALGARLEQILPTRLGYTLAEVELNAQYILTTNLFLTHAEGHMPQVVEQFSLILERLGIDPATRKLRERDDKTLTLTLVVVKLFAQIVRHAWALTAVDAGQAGQAGHAGQAGQAGQVGHAGQPENEAPPELVDVDVHHTLEVLFCLILEELHRHALAQLRGRPLEPAQPHAAAVDAHIAHVLRYIAAANPVDYHLFVQRKLFAWADKGEYVPSPALKKYSLLLRHVYHTPSVAAHYPRQVYAMMPYVRLALWKQLLLYYVLRNIEHECFARADFYPDVARAGGEAHHRVLFDYVCLVFENSGVAPLLQLWFCVLCTLDFDEALARPNKLKQAFNKRLKFLLATLKDAHAGHADSFELLVSIFSLGARAPPLGVRAFSLQHLDETHAHLKRLQKPHHALVVRFYVAAIAFFPEKYTRLLLADLPSRLRLRLCGPDLCADVQAVVLVVKGLAAVPQFLAQFAHVMAELHEDFRVLMFSSQRVLEPAVTRLPKPAEKPLLGLEKFQTNPLLSTIKKNAEEYGSLVVDRVERCEREKNDATATAELVLADLLEIFSAAPELYMRPLFERTNLADLTTEAAALAQPIKHAISVGSAELFEAASRLALTLVGSRGSLRDTPLKECAGFILSNLVVKAIAEACAQFSLTDANFKLCFIFMNRFLEERQRAFGQAHRNPLVREAGAHVSCALVNEAVEIILLLALCTHDVQFFGMAKISMHWHTHEVRSTAHAAQCFELNLSATFQRILDDDSVFTGFVSLHKKFRNILMEAVPTMSLYHVYQLIYNRWLDKVEGDPGVGDLSLVFRHYTGFLVLTLGCFLDELFAKHTHEKPQALALLSAFFDRAINLLVSSELVIRVVIKDALSNESHLAVFHLICTKLMNVGMQFADQTPVTEEGTLFIEQMITILSTMVSIKNDGSFVLVSLLPGVCDFLIKFIGQVSNPQDHLKLKLRFCKLVHAIEDDRVRNGIAGAHKLRNVYAKSSAEWLEQAVFSEMAGGDSELEYLQIELASECLRSLEFQLQDLVLEIPDGTKEKNVKHAKDLIFSNYFSLFYKILEKYASCKPTPLSVTSKYKIQAITDNVLKCISNILQLDIEFGMQFVLPLGFHDNRKIRLIFLNVFANTLSARKLSIDKEEFPEELIERMLDIYPLYGAAAGVASLAEHNLLASSLYGLFAYSKKLDKLFLTLLEEEVSSVTRSTDIFRSNSTLTRLMSIFAKEYGLPYLTVVLKPFILEVMSNDVEFEVEKSCEASDVDLFMLHLEKLVNTIVTSNKWVPESFRCICAEVYQCVRAKFEDAALVAVGLFLFLRFFCPAIVSPETFFDLSTSNFKVKRLFIQLVKVIQYMANGSLNMLKWPGLACKLEQLNDLNKKIFHFLESIALDTWLGYAFHAVTMKPYTALRYIHKFLYSNFVLIKHRYILGDPLGNAANLHERVLIWRRLDQIMLDLGSPKLSILLEGTASFKSYDGNPGNSQYTEFMAKMSAKNIEVATDTQIVRSAVFKDGTPVIIVNYRCLKEVGYDMSTFVYFIFEAASQVWDNRFFMVHDFTQFFYMGIIGRNYVSLMRNYAPSAFFKNCAHTYYFNLPRERHLFVIDEMLKLRGEANSQLYFYLLADRPDVISNLCLDELVLAINKDVRVVFNCMLYEEKKQQFVPVTLKLGRRWMQLCLERIPYKKAYTGTDLILPVEAHLLADITRCEATATHGDNEFTLTLNRYNYEVVLTLPLRQEVLRFLYFAMLRNAKMEDTGEETDLQWFGKLYNGVFHGLLDPNEEVRYAALYLFALLSSYFDVDFGISPLHARRIAFPADTTDFIVSVLSYLAAHRREQTHQFLTAFLDNYERLPERHRISGFMYLLPWLDNAGVVLMMDKGREKAADIVRQLCKVTAQSAGLMPFLNAYVWKKLFAEIRLSLVLLDEIVGFAIDNKCNQPEWVLIISVIAPSVELCGEVISRLIKLIHHTSKHDNTVASSLKLLEITVLVKVCALTFFNTLAFGTLYLADVFFLCTLFIDTPELEFGLDLQKLVINTVQLFSHRGGLLAAQAQLIDDTIEYFSGQRARMLFGLNLRSAASADLNQAYNRSTAFDLLCDYLIGFIEQIGLGDDKARWMARWLLLATDIAFSRLLRFQRRLIALVATLARGGIKDSSAGRVLRLLAQQLLEDPTFLTDAGICFSRIEQGLHPDSLYLPLVVWAQLVLSILELPLLYQLIATCLANTLGKLYLAPNYLSHVVLCRAHLEPHLSRLELRLNARVTRANFKFAILYTVCQGLTTPHFRHTLVACLHTIVRSRISHATGEVLEGFTRLHFLLVLGLATADSACATWETDEVARQIAANTDETRLVLLLVARIFDADSDSTFKNNFVRFYCRLFDSDRALALTVIHVVRRGLQNSLVESVSETTVHAVLRLFVAVRESHIAAAEAQETALLRKFDFERLRSFGEFKSDLAWDDSEPAAQAQEMLYKSFGSVVEGLRLERF